MLVHISIFSLTLQCCYGHIVTIVVFHFLFGLSMYHCLCRDNQVLVEVHGPRPENILLLIHEVYESLIADFFQGVKYEYFLPCTDCMKQVLSNYYYYNLFRTMS